VESSKHAESLFPLGKPKHARKANGYVCLDIKRPARAIARTIFEHNLVAGVALPPLRSIDSSLNGIGVQRESKIRAVLIAGDSDEDGDRLTKVDRLNDAERHTDTVRAVA